MTCSEFKWIHAFTHTDICTHTETPLFFVVRGAQMGSRWQMLKQWIGRSCLHSCPLLFSLTCLISCRTLSHSPFSTPHFLDCSLNSIQSAVRCELYHFLCQRWIITTYLPKITPCLCFPHSSIVFITAVLPCASQNPSWRVKLSRLQTILMSVSRSVSFMWTTVSEKTVLSGWEFLGTDTVKQIKTRSEEKMQRLWQK